MKILIMCGGVYDFFNTPKQLSVINGETLIERTIRLLKENGATDISITTDTDNNWFDNLDVPIIKFSQTFKVDKNKKGTGYWLDAYYPIDEPCIYLHGDVYYSDNAIKRILNYDAKVNTFIGNDIAKNPMHYNWGEPFGWIIVNQKDFKDGIKKAKQLQDEGKLVRDMAISWELYRVLNGLDPNKQFIIDDTYLEIADETIDIDSPTQIEVLDARIRARGN